MGQVGFDDVEATLVAQTLVLESGSSFVDAVLHGAVRTKALLLAQDPAALAQIKTAVAEGIYRLFRSGIPAEFRCPQWWALV
jgi:hypothetical protein